MPGHIIFTADCDSRSNVVTVAGYDGDGRSPIWYRVGSHPLRVWPPSHLRSSWAVTHLAFARARDHHDVIINAFDLSMSLALNTARVIGRWVACFLAPRRSFDTLPPPSRSDPSFILLSLPHLFPSRLAVARCTGRGKQLRVK